MSPILLVADRSPMFTTTVVVAGVSIVLGVLLLLILVFQLFGLIMSKLTGKKTKKNTPAPAPAPVRKDAAVPALKNSAKPAPAVSQGISGEVVAAIAAAVVQMDGNGAVIKSIKPVRKVERKDVRSRNPWATAAVSDNTRPF